jgi:hypothetical protein
MRNVIAASFTFLIAASAHAETPANVTAKAEYNDFLFPHAGEVSLTGSTGIPFAALGEIGVGITDRIAVGALAAGGPFAGGVVFGIYPRFDVVHVGPMRLVLESAALWYPALNGADNWFLVRPMMRVEGHTGRVRIHGSAGAIVAKMAGEPVQGPIAPYGGNGLPSGVQQGAAWNTWGGGIAVALSKRTSVFAEGFVLCRGFELAGTEWFQVPFDSFVGVSTTL